ncbi:MAG: hypothetical protein GY795_06425 [Desulfobacterales bacterium]|nr:hypothetical protein [Desulfobacterales bacterium]
MDNNTYNNHPNLGSLVRLLFLLMAIIAIFGCATDSAPVYVKNGKEYGRIQETFRNRWWNHYERGLSFADGEYYREAVADLRQAIDQRKKDQRMARTYGMHFIDYFPHRELGVIYYQTRDMEAAMKELEISLDQFPSAKARFYLDCVRKEMIERKGEETGNPKLVLDYGRQEIWTKEDPIIISGVAEDENYISGITVMGTSFFLEGAQKQVSFRKSFSLSQGRHVIEVAALNLPGKAAKQRIILHVDREGPTITINELWKNDSEPGFMISGSVYDDSGVSELSINGQPATVQKKTELFFNKKIVPDNGGVELAATDRLGNRTSARIPLHRSRPGFHTTTHNPKIKNPILLASADSDVYSFLTASFFGSKDKTPPTIKLKGWADAQEVFLDKIYLEGKVSDENKIVSLSVDHIPVLRREGQYIFFGTLLDLKQGKNNILIQAEDKAGNRAEKKITVIRKIPNALRLEERLSMTVLPFVQTGEVSEFSASFHDNLINSLVNQNRFRIIERDRLDAILYEQKLSRTELADRDTAIRLGRLIAAGSVLTGTVVETRSGIEIVARLIDTETSEILATEDAYDELKNLSALKNLSEGIAVKFHRDFPLLDGMVVRQKENHIFIDIGGDTIRRQRRFIVYQEEPLKHPVTGKILGADNVIKGHARITQVMPELSKARILDGDAIKLLDKVISE